MAVSSNSHEAIRNVLKACVDALVDDDLPFDAVDLSLVHKGKREDEPLNAPKDRIHMAKGNDDPALLSADVVGGVAWLFARPELAGAFDHLFVDEAGSAVLAVVVCALAFFSLRPPDAP